MLQPLSDAFARRIRVLCSLTVALTLSSAVALAQPDHEVIYSEITGTPSASIPGALDLSGMPVAAEWMGLLDMVFSPDGTQWIVRGQTNLGSDLLNIMLLGSGNS
ncbi:MAG: hypothetical protein KDC38_13665, partial [Planctomycetes bacterium]|nr:hypothetical protein [Planctomycetota bacterium]